MFLGYQNNKIAFIAETKEELENIPFVTLDKIEETDKEYILLNGEYKLKDESKTEIALINRVAEYPSINEQLDMLYWDKINGTNNWEELITNIKTKYPKE